MTAEKAGWTRQFGWFKALANKCRLFLLSGTVFYPVLTLSGFLAPSIVAQMGLQWTLGLTAEKEAWRLCYQTALLDFALPPEGQEHESLCSCVGLCWCSTSWRSQWCYTPMVPHNIGAREATKHPAGWGSAAGGAERWIHHPKEITSPKSIKMFVFKKKSAFFPHFCCHLSV